MPVSRPFRESPSAPRPINTLRTLSAFLLLGMVIIAGSLVGIGPVAYAANSSSVSSTADIVLMDKVSSPMTDRSDSRSPVAAAGAPSPASTASYYVSPSGNDSNPGTLGAPWRTLQRAANTVSAGAKVLIRAGTYSSFVMSRSGTANAPITFRAYGTERVVVDGGRSVAYTIKVVNARHVRFRWLEIRGGYASGYAGAGITTENSSNIDIRHNLIADNKAWGVRAYNSTYVTIYSNEITGNAVGIQINLAGEGSRISNNLVHHNTQMIVNTPNIGGDDVGGEGIALVKSSGRVTVDRNRIWGNRGASYDYGYDGAAFSVYGASNWTIKNNTTWDNRNVMETGTDANRTPCDNNRFVRNVNYGATTVDRTVGMVLRCSSNMLIANNTFYGMQHFVFDISHNQGSWGASIAGLRIVNNIVVAEAKIYGIESWPLPASVEINHNLVRRTDGGWVASVVGIGGTSDLGTFRAWTGYEEDSVQGDPLFASPGNGDFHIRPGSAAIDRGVVIPGVTDGYRGSSPDLGRFEY